MASKPPIECPLCNNVPQEDHTLEKHLMRTHRQRELAKHIIAEYEANQEGGFS